VYFHSSAKYDSRPIRSWFDRSSNNDRCQKVIQRAEAREQDIDKIISSDGVVNKTDAGHEEQHTAGAVKAHNQLKGGSALEAAAAMPHAAPQLNCTRRSETAAAARHRQQTADAALLSAACKALSAVSTGRLTNPRTASNC
jgi:hypothetical protein